MNNADTTLQQLGGAGRLSAMIGARDFMSSDAGATLLFKIGAKNAARINYAEITLDPSDTYTVKLYAVKRGGFAVTPAVERSFVYADQLRGVIESATGLRLSL